MDFFNNLQDYFSTLTNQEMLFFWLVAGLLFVIGLLIGLLIQSSRLKRYRAQYMITDKERADFQARAISAEGKLGALEKEVATLSREKVAVVEELEQLKKQSIVGEDPAELEKLREEVQLLQSENQRLTKSLNDYRSSNPVNNQEDSDKPNPNTDEPAGQTADVQDYIAAAEARFEAFEQRLQELTSENDRLNTEVSQLQGGTNRGLDVPYGTPHQPIIGTVDTDEDGEPLVIRADVTDPGARTDNDGSMEVIVDHSPSVVLPVLPPEDVSPDDLKLINNIGPFLEKKLNEQGVFTYKQLAAWSAQDINEITESIGYVPGVITKDNWVEQAKYLLDNPPSKAIQEEVVEQKPTKKKTTQSSKGPKEDNLRIVEGIGPKIEKILKEAGVTTLSELASQTPDKLRAILADAGNRFKSHNPETWPEQARLAANGELDALKVMQDAM